MNWEHHKAHWPNAQHSRFVNSRPHRWHVQEMGSGPLALLLHGAGGATHSWRDVIPLLAKTHRVVAIDLPGHGFTTLGTKQRCALDRMSEDVYRLCSSEGWAPEVIIGHSAGAALALRLAEGGLSPRGQVVGINAALSNFKGIAGWLFPMMARMLAMNPFTANFFVATATPQSVTRLIEGTGSTLDADGMAQYQRLIGARSHVDGTLAMMAQWSLDGLIARLPQNTARTLFITGDRDKAVPPSVSDEAAAQMPDAQVIHLPNLGHLAHEESPGEVVDLIRGWLSQPVRPRGDSVNV